MDIKTEAEGKSIQMYFYKDMTLLSYFKNKNKNNVFVIQEKKNKGKQYSATFRH